MGCSRLGCCGDCEVGGLGVFELGCEGWERIPTAPGFPRPRE